MYRNTLLIEDCGLKLDDAGKLAFCSYDDGMAASNLIVTFDAEPTGQDEAGNDTFEISIVSTAWYLARENYAQHFNKTDALHIAAEAFALETELGRMIEMAAEDYGDARDNPEYLVAA
jgi:hypothetical protein